MNVPCPRFSPGAFYLKREDTPLCTLGDENDELPEHYIYLTQAERFEDMRKRPLCGEFDIRTFPAEPEVNAGASAICDGQTCKCELTEAEWELVDKYAIEAAHSY